MTTLVQPGASTRLGRGSLYMLHEREFRVQNSPVHKFGFTRKSIQNRMRGYPKASDIRMVIPVDRPLQAETAVLDQAMHPGADNVHRLTVYAVQWLHKQLVAHAACLDNHDASAATTTAASASSVPDAQADTASYPVEMSVILLDFGPSGPIDANPEKMLLPFGVSVSFIKGAAAEKSFILKSDIKELTYDFSNRTMRNWNGFDGVSVPGTDIRFEGKGVKIIACATSGENNLRYPVVEIIPRDGKGKLYLSQIITDGRVMDVERSGRYNPKAPAHDPMAVQFLLNLISATVGDNLLK
jgi:hypothetical protein